MVPVEAADNFESFLASIRAGKYGGVILTNTLYLTRIESVFVGRDRKSLSIVGKEMNVAEGCSAFVKITVTSEQPPAAGPVGVQPVRNAFDVLMLNQKQ